MNHPVLNRVIKACSFVQEFAGDNDALFEAEREEALARARELEQQKQNQVALSFYLCVNSFFHVRIAALWIS